MTLSEFMDWLCDGEDFVPNRYIIAEIMKHPVLGKQHPLISGSVGTVLQGIAELGIPEDLERIAHGETT